MARAQACVWPEVRLGSELGSDGAWLGVACRIGWGCRVAAGHSTQQWLGAPHQLEAAQGSSCAPCGWAGLVYSFNKICLESGAKEVGLEWASVWCAARRLGSKFCAAQPPADGPVFVLEVGHENGSCQLPRFPGPPTC